MKSTGYGFLNNVKALGTGTEAVEIAILAGKDKNGKQRFNNGSFIITKNTKGWAEVKKLHEESKKDNSEDNSVFVKVVLADVHATASSSKDKLYVNFTGMVDTIEQYSKENKEK